MSEAHCSTAWSSIPGNSRYKINRRGEIMGLRGWLRKQKLTKWGYLTIGLEQDDGEQQWFLVHRLVAATFLGKCPDGNEVNHKNGIKTDNRLENLEYVTCSYNHVHAFATGLRSHKGESHPSAKLTDDDVREIRTLARTKMQKNIAVQFGVSKMTISLIVRGKRWSHVQ